MYIQVDTSNLFEISNEIKSVQADIQHIVDQVEKVVFSSIGSWQGEAERAFAEKIMYVKKQFVDTGAFFDEYANLLKNFAYMYEQQEKDLSSKINLA